MKNTLLVILLLLPALAFSQNVGRFGYVFAMDSLRLKAIVDSISIDSTLANASNRKLATTYAVKSYADRHLGSRDASTAAPSSGDVWKWNGSQWAPAADATGGGGVSDGDKVDIDVTGSGTVWTVDTAAITNIKIDANAIDSTKIANGGVSVLDLGQHGASAGQVLKWNGTQWLPANDSIGSDGNGIYGGSGTVSGETNATLDGEATLNFRYSGPSNAISISDGGGSVKISDNSGTKSVEVNGFRTDITGELRVSDITSGNPTRLLGADSDNDFVAVKLGTGLSLSNDTLRATATGTVTGTATAGQVTYWNGTSSITGESGFEYDATNNRLGINKTSPAVTLDIQQANASDGVRIQTDGTLDQDVWGLQLVGTATGPYTQRGRIGLDVYSNAGVSPQGQAFVFNLATDASGTTNPLLLYTNQAIFNNASEFTLANNTGRLRLEASATGGLYTTKNLLVTSSSYTTADTSTRLRVVGRTNGTATFPARFFDGGNGLIMAIRDDKRVGINASTIDAALHTNGLGSTSSTYGLIVTNSTTTTSTASLVVRDDNRVGIRTNAPQAPLNVVGTGTTSSTTALLVEGSGGQDNLNVRDDGVNIGQGFAMASSAPTIAFGNAAGTGPTNDLCTGGGNGFWLNFTTGTSPTTNASIFTATLPKSYPNGVVATWSCGDTDCLDEAADIYISGTGNNSVTLSTRGTLTASTSYSIYVTCFGY